MKKALIFLTVLALLIMPAAAANYTMTNQYTLNATAFTYFRYCLGNAAFDDQYIIFQNTQYISICFIGKFTVSGNTVACQSGQLISYDSNASTTDRRYISSSSGTGHTITITPGLVYYTNIQDIASNPIPASVQEYKDVSSYTQLNKALEGLDKALQWLTDLYANNKYVLWVIVFLLFVYIAFQFIKKRWISIW